eukprot:2306489-Lingulodinium_polyedra.AAC.1
MPMYVPKSDVTRPGGDHEDGTRDVLELRLVRPGGRATHAVRGVGGIVDQFEREERPCRFRPGEGPDEGRRLAGERIGLPRAQP